VPARKAFDEQKQGLACVAVEKAANSSDAEYHGTLYSLVILMQVC
jgi:hypothetical protein